MGEKQTAVAYFTTKTTVRNLLFTPENMNVYTRESAVGQQEQDRCKEWEVSLKEDDVMRQKGYTVTGLLGEGTYSKVKRAFSKRMKRDVAVKIIAKEEAPRTFRERFLPREIAILSKIRHGNILRVYEIFELVSPQRVYIVTELMQHGDLLEKVKAKGAMRERCASLIVADVCRALAYLHAQHIAHRDVKCENILLSRRQPIEGERCLTYTAKLCDFGFARSFHPLVPAADHYGEEVFLVTDTFCGSAAYASPEILERRPHDARSADVWALGIVFFIVLVGSMPFDD